MTVPTTAPAPALPPIPDPASRALPALAAVIGVDWATDQHDVALQALDAPGGAATGAVEECRVRHTPEALAAWLATLERRFGGQPIGVAIETSRGPVVHALLDAPFIVLYPVNPRSLRRFRETFSPNGAKDDAPDARLLLRLLVHHRDQLRSWRAEDAPTRLLQRLVEQRRAAVDLRTQLTLQLQAVLKEYFPQALTWAGDDLTSPLASAFLTRWPTLAVLQRARPATVHPFFTRHGCRRQERIAARLEEIQAARPLTRDAAVITSGELAVQLLVGQLTALRPSLAKLDATIAAHFAAHADAPLFASFPGAGAALAPRLLVALGTDRARFPSAADVQTHTGIAPITVRSGRQQQVHWRWATSTFLRQTFHEFAHHSIRHTAWAHAFYAQQRRRGKTHHAAVRTLAFKWIRIIWRCWHDRQPYDNARYERALQLHHSPLSELLAIDVDAA
jgi:transposase